ncbi:MAG: hypothetical protein COA36_06620 [Desulfotalea sp.]|nr:MAG: hypothetical protein COA36_06620 [Desulfotalea sp.]
MKQFLSSCCLVALIAASSCPAIAGANKSRLRISGPPVAESLVFAIMAQQHPDRLTFTPWHSPDQARAMIAGGKIDVSLTTTSAAAIFYAKGIPVRIAGVFDSALWVISTKQSSGPLPMEGILLFPFGHREMPELLFNTILGDRCPNLTTRHTGGALETANLLQLGRADHALLAEPAASLVLKRSNETGGPVLIKHLDLRQEWGKKFNGLPLYVSALAVFGDATHRNEEIKALVKFYNRTRIWIGEHPATAMAMAHETAPSISTLMSESGDGIIAGQLFADKRAFDAAFFFLGQIHSRYPDSLGDSFPDKRLFFGEN